MRFVCQRTGLSAEILQIRSVHRMEIRFHAPSVIIFMNSMNFSSLRNFSHESSSSSSSSSTGVSKNKSTTFDGERADFIFHSASVCCSSPLLSSTLLKCVAFAFLTNWIKFNGLRATYWSESIWWNNDLQNLSNYNQYFAQLTVSRRLNMWWSKSRANTIRK